MLLFKMTYRGAVVAVDELTDIMGLFEEFEPPW
jgi:hypothetical protein